MKRTLTLMLTAAGALALSACATNGIPRSQVAAANVQAYNDAAGAPVSSLTKMGANFQSWESLSKEQLVVYTRPNQAYLLTVAHCPPLEFSHAIRVSDSMGRVQTNFDRVYPLDRSPMAEIGCPIRTIQPVDMAKFRTLTAAFQQARPER